MLAAFLDLPGRPLALREVVDPVPGSGQVLIRVRACGVCRTDLHVVDGELADPKLPLIPGHQIVGLVSALGPGVTDLAVGDRVGVPWLGGTCGHCAYCTSERENLCDGARFTGYNVDGGFAEYCVADRRYCFPLPRGSSDLEVAPLLCAGLIGHRALRMCGDAKTIGIWGFGSAAHIVTQVARFEQREIHAFTRADDQAAQSFARKMGAVWAGASDQAAATLLDAAIVFAPAGHLVPLALRSVKKGGVVVLGGIHMSDIPSFPYEILWGERVLRSVANLTRRDAEEFLALAPRVPVRTEVVPYPLSSVGMALDDLRRGRLLGAAVIVLD